MSSYPAPPPFDPTGGSGGNNSKPNTNSNSDTTAPTAGSSNDDNTGGSSSNKPSGGGYPAPPPFDPNPKPNKPSTGGSNTNDGPATIGGDNRASYKLEFDKIDVNNSGSIDPIEIENLFMGMVPKSLIKKAVSFVDTNRDGKIDFEEYAAIREKLSALKKK